MTSGALPDRTETLVQQATGKPGPLLWLTGAGISAESGVPTFRGKEGYWQVGSRNYHPQDMATRSAFAQRPDDVWSWYLYRRGVCRSAEPNAAHRALAELEARIGDRFLLVTQNIDGLHLRAGNSRARAYAIHGDIEHMRCAGECTDALDPIPEEVDPHWEHGRGLGEAERKHLVCPRCGGRARPHVLWFDEVYDEPRFRFESAMDAASRCALLVVVGTTGVTNLPLQIGMLVARRRAPMIVINPEPSPFTEMTERTGGDVLEGTAGEWVPPLARYIGECGAGPATDTD